MEKILNTWTSKVEKLQYYEVKKPIYVLNEYRIFKLFDKAYLHTYKNFAISCLCGANKELIKALNDDIRVHELRFLFDRAKESIEICEFLTKNKQ